MDGPPLRRFGRIRLERRRVLVQLVEEQPGELGVARERAGGAGVPPAVTA